MTHELHEVALCITHPPHKLPRMTYLAYLAPNALILGWTQGIGGLRIAEICYNLL